MPSEHLHRRSSDADKLIGDGHTLVDGRVVWHAHFVDGRTLCGIDITSPEPHIPYGQLITCDACRHVWNVSQLFNYNDFVRPNIL